MSTSDLWLRLVDEDDDAVSYPRLGYGEHEFSLSDRARWVLAAIALPRELSPAVASDELQRRRLGPNSWSSGEIMARIPYQHRSTIKHAFADLRAQLAEHGLALEEFLELDTRRGRYGLRPGRVQVDLLSLHAAREDPDAFDALLAAGVSDPRRAGLAPICHELLQGSVHAELETAIAAAARRLSPPSATEPSPEIADGRPRGRRRLPRPRLARPAVAAVAVAVAVVAVVLLITSGGHQAQAQAARIEVAGGAAHTWSNPRTAGGRAARPLQTGERVRISCRVRGYQVPDGDVWWYRLAPPPWSGRFYATADAFYNNGRTHGSLIGSKLVDRRIPVC
jgi:hypothetical protein